MFSKINDARDEAFRNIEKSFKEEKESYDPDEVIFHLNDMEFKRKLKIRELINHVMEVRTTLTYLEEKNIEEIYSGFNGSKEYTEEDLVGIYT